MIYETLNISKKLKESFAEIISIIPGTSPSIPSYTTSTRPAANSTPIGTQIWLTDKSTLMVCTGTTWINIGVPIGEVVAMTHLDIPAGFAAANGALCNGVADTQYSDLFDYWGSAMYGGTGKSSFNLPNLQGRFLRGFANGSANDPDRTSRTDRGDGTAGDAVGTQQGHAMQDHRHWISGREYDDGNDNQQGNGQDLGIIGDAGSYSVNDQNKSGFGRYVAYTSFQPNSTSSGATTGSDNRPINTSVRYCIKL